MNKFDYFTTEQKLNQYKFEAIDFCIKSGISKELINEGNIEIFISENYKTLILEMKERVYGVQEKTHLRVPRTWFDMWLIHRAPKWIAKHFKINYLELSVKETAIIPGVNVPRGQQHFMLTEVEQEF